jgi:hypothetical protein
MALPYGLSIEEAITVLKPLLQFVVGMVIYSVLIYHFYKFLAKKDVITLDLSRYKESKHAFIKILLRTLVYIFENILFVPLFTFLWFAVLTVIISFMAREQAAQTIILVSMALVATVRITAYYKEELSVDLAKVLPFTLLAVFITEASTFSYSGFLETMISVLANWKIWVYYFAFAAILEMVLNFGYEIFHPPQSR